jgi:uracil-DNA glycosylase family 4
MNNILAKFFQDVGSCPACYGEGNIFVPKCSTRSGDMAPRIFILGEQPEREACLVNGTNGLESPDPTVDRLREMLKIGGVSEADVFYTTSVLCIPKDAAKRGPRPSWVETRNCTGHVRKLLQMMSPKLIIPLGHTSILSVQEIYKDWTELRQYILNYDVGNVLEKDGTAVYPLYHTSEGTLKVRSRERQVRDWKQIPKILSSVVAKTTTK